MNIQLTQLLSPFSILSSVALSGCSILSVWRTLTHLLRPSSGGVAQIFDLWRMMKGRAMEQSSAYAACEEMIMMMGSVSVVCPKPRRVALFNDHIPPLRWHVHHDDSNDESELLDIILTKGSERSGHQVASSPPYFCGSPPSRASNPVVQDAQFGKEKLTPFSRAPSPARKPVGGGGGGGAGGVRMMKFGTTPAAVRIEGFDCLGRDGQSRSISAVA